MAKQVYELRSIVSPLTNYLSGLGWSGVTVKRGFLTQETIQIPMVGFYYLPSSKFDLQMGTASGEQSYNRRIQVDCYMENEDRASAIADDIADFLELTTVSVVDKNSTPIGFLYVPNNQSISIDVAPPILANPKIIRWRSLVKAVIHSHYNI